MTIPSRACEPVLEVETYFADSGAQSGSVSNSMGKIISIHHEFEGGIEKSVRRITGWHHEACRVMTIGDREGRIFLSHPHAHDGYFFLLTTKNLI